MVAGLGESNVPLTEDILKKEFEFVKTFLEWISNGNAEQIIRDAARTTGGTSTLYTVARNTTLFITSAWIAGVGTSIGTVINFFLEEADRNLKFLRNYSFENTPSSSSITYSMPIRIESGQSIVFTIAIGQASAAGGFTGYLLPKRIA